MQLSIFEFIFYGGLILLLATVGYTLWGVYKVLVIDKRNYASYWREQAAAEVPPGAIKLVAIGDSTFQALGASKPQNGTVGLAAEYLRKNTNRPVHVTNLSVSGAKAQDVAEKQLWLADFKSADIVMVAVGANDALKGSDIKIFEESIQKIVKKVPSDRTVMADVAFVRNRESYQSKVENIRDDTGILRANLEYGFRNAGEGRNLSARDFFHPSDYGYTFWFASFQPEIDKLINSHNLAK